MEEHNQTHPNAYRTEAAAKLAEATRLSAEAEALEAKAKELEDAEGITANAAPEQEDDASSDTNTKRKLLRK